MPRSTVKFSQSSTTVDQTLPSHQQNHYSPSVPISVYRQLAAELEVTQEQLQSLQKQNQQLVEQNQQLRQEAKKVFQSAQKLQQALSAFSAISATTQDSADPMFDVEQMLRQTAASKTSKRRKFTPPPEPRRSNTQPQQEPPESEKLVAEVQTIHYRHATELEGDSSEINGWLLAFSVFVIVVMAFGTGFLLMRPLLKGNSSSR